MSRLDAALEYVKRNPPTYQLLAAFVGFEAPDTTRDPMEDFLAALAASGLGVVEGWGGRGN